MDWTSNSATGKKRPPGIDGDDDFIAEQPLSKKLAKLSLHKEEQSRNRRDQQLQKRQNQVTLDSERMEVDNDSSHVVFIHDIDEELGNHDGDENNKKGLIFVPDIEKRLTRIPYALASEGSSKISAPSFETSQALVLYTVPSSLSVSREQDNVRRAIIEARARIRQKQAGGTKQQGLMETGEVVAENVDGSGFGSGLSGDDPDAMDIE